MQRRITTLIAVAALGVVPLALVSSASPDPALAADGTTIANEGSYRVAPGLFLKKWTQYAGGLSNEGYALISSVDEPTLNLRYLGPARLRTRYPLSTLLAQAGAVAGVNASFFDIGDTGAPIGTGVSNGQILYATTVAKPAFVINANGSGDVRAIQMREITNTGWADLDNRIDYYNSPELPAHSIGMYDANWYSTVGKRVMPAGGSTFFELWVTNGVVTNKSWTLTDGEVIPAGRQVLVGHGAGAQALAAIPIGTPLSLPVALYGNLNLQLAVSAGDRLVRDGANEAGLSTAGLAPRTAIGWDPDLRRVILAVINGRSESSDGVTENGMANAMRDLGADEALLLDGGGSAQLMARYAGNSYIWNSPSDGVERAVPNGIGFVSAAPDPTFN